MKYFIVQYFTQPDGKMEEQIWIAKKLKKRDLQTANVIMDFSQNKIIIANLKGSVIPKDWIAIRNYYHRYYPKVIEEMESYNNNKK